MITIATLLWDANENSLPFSRSYDESWVEKLYRGFARNLTVPFRFQCWSNRMRTYSETAIRPSFLGFNPSYGDCMYPLTTGEPTILVGLDTVVLRNIDHLAQWCLTPGDKLGLPRDPFHWSQACNGVILAPENFCGPHRRLDRDVNDMDWCRAQPHVFIDDIFSGSVKSYKGHVRGMTDHFAGHPQGFDGIDICYLHGVPKQDMLGDIPEIAENWK